MLSKFLRSAEVLRPRLLLGRIKRLPQVLKVRKAGEYLPPSQYDIPLPKRLSLLYTLSVYWETIPLFVTTAISMAIVVIAVIWACKNKVDIVFSSYSRENISRTMDLRNPSVHKMLIINQRYEPWPEMQDVLDKMRLAEKRALLRAQSCSHP